MVGTVESFEGPPVPEVEPNDTIGSANPLVISSVITGTIPITSDLDVFSFTAGAGERRGAIEVAVPRVNDQRVDAEGNRQRFTSKILPPYPYLRRTRSLEA